jgi:hypothetical protein
MGFSSQGGHVAFRTQAAPDTFPADFVANSVAMRLRSGSLSTNRDLLIPDPEIGGGRDIADAYLGAVVWSGDYELYPRLRSLPILLNAAFGIKATGPAGVQEINTFSTTGTVTGGTFTITYNSQTTTALPYNATAAQVQAALQALSNIGDNDVMVTGGPVPVSPALATSTPSCPATRRSCRSSRSRSRSAPPAWKCSTTPTPSSTPSTWRRKPTGTSWVPSASSPASSRLASRR